MKEKIEKILKFIIEPSEYWTPISIIADIILIIIGLCAKAIGIIGIGILLTIIDTTKLLEYTEDKIYERNKKSDKSGEECNISKKT